MPGRHNWIGGKCGQRWDEWAANEAKDAGTNQGSRNNQQTRKPGIMKGRVQGQWKGTWSMKMAEILDGMPMTKERQNERSSKANV